MKEIKLKVNIDGDENISKVDKEIKNLDQSSQDYNKTTDTTIEKNKDSKQSLGDLISESDLFADQLGIVNRIKSVYNAGMSTFVSGTNAGAGATGKLTKALHVLKVALVSTGIGAIAVAVGTLASAFMSTQRGVDALQSVLTPTVTVLQRMWGVVQDLAFLLVDGKFSEAIAMIWNLDEAIQGAWNDGQKLADMKIKLREATLKWTVAEAKLNKEISESKRVVEDQTASFEAREKALDTMAQKITERLNKEKQMIKDKIAILETEMDQNDNSLEQRERMAELEAELLRADQEASDARQEFQSIRNGIESEREANAKAQADRNSRELAGYREAERLLFEQVDNERQRLGMLSQLRMNEALDKRTQRIEEAKRTIDDETALAQELRIIKQDYENEVTSIERDNAQARVEIAEAEKQARIDTALEVGNALMALSRLAGEQTAFGKALAVVSATIDTYVGANKALAQGGIFGVASAVGIIATGLANVKQIMSTEVPSIQGQPLGTPASSPQRQSAPRIEAPDVGGQGVSTVNTLFPKDDRPIKAYVVETDITETQNNVREIEESATF